MNRKFFKKFGRRTAASCLSLVLCFSGTAAPVLADRGSSANMAATSDDAGASNASVPANSGSASDVAVPSDHDSLSDATEIVGAAGATDNQALNDAAEEISSQPDVQSGEEVADNIKTILQASSQLGTADASQVADLQASIDTVSAQYEGLTDEEKDALSQSRELLDAASSAVDDMADTLHEVNSGAQLTIEQTGRENSFRYVDGEKISDAVHTVSEEQQDVAEIAGQNAADSDDHAAAEESSSDDTSLYGAGTEDPSADGNTSSDSTGAASDGNTSSDNTGTVSGESQEDANTVVLTAASTTYKGIDVSVHQKEIDWQKVKNSGISFAILRCGYGSDLTEQDDKRWAYNVAQCEKYGIPYGVYLYSYATTTEQIDSEVRHTLRLLQGHTPALPVYIDMEDNTQLRLGTETLCAFANRFCDQIAAAGYKAGLYSSTNCWNRFFGDFALLPGYYHWIAQYNTVCTYRGNYESWQFSSKGEVDGISGSVDMNLWYNTLGAKAAGSSDYMNIADGTYTIRNSSHQDFTVDVKDGSTGDWANIQLYSANNTDAQKFTFTGLGNGCYLITNVKSGKAVDVLTGSMAEDANIQQYTVNRSYAQQWIPRKNADGSVTLINAGSFRYMDIDNEVYANGTNIKQHSPTGSEAQKFVLTSASASGDNSSDTGKNNGGNTDSGDTPAAEDLDGTYYIACCIRQDMVLDVNGASAADGANVQLYTLNRTNAQRFTFKSLGNGYYSIINVSSGKPLDVSGASQLNGANIQQYHANGTYAQQWKVVQNSDRTFTIISRASGKVIDVDAGIYTNGRNVQQYSSNGTNAQKFVLLDVTEY